MANSNPYAKYKAETKMGVMFNIMTPWNSSDGKFKDGACNWVRAEDVIGVESRGGKFYLRVKFVVGMGINGVDSEIQVTEDAFEMVCLYFSIP